MSTLRQIEANRRNALKSTGPRTAAGKAASSSNALQHGVYANSPVLTGEDSAEYQAFARSYQERFQPATPEERTLLLTVALNAWHLNRYTRVETQLWNEQIERHSLKGDPRFLMSDSFFQIQKTLLRLRTLVNAAERAFRGALTLLNKLQAQRKQELPAENGFVPSKPAPPAKPVPQPVQMTSPNPHAAPRNAEFPPFSDAS